MTLAGAVDVASLALGGYRILFFHFSPHCAPALWVNVWFVGRFIGCFLPLNVDHVPLKNRSHAFIRIDQWRAQRTSEVFLKDWSAEFIETEELKDPLPV